MQSAEGIPLHDSVSVFSLTSFYETKCRNLGLHPNPTISLRLQDLDASHESCFDMSGVAADDTLECVLEVMMVAAGVSSVAFGSCDLDDHHVEALAHCLCRCSSVCRLDVSSNPHVTDVGGQFLLDWADTTGRVFALRLEGTHVTPALLSKISSSLKSPSGGSPAAHAQPTEDTRLLDDARAADRVHGLLENTRLLLARSLNDPGVLDGSDTKVALAKPVPTSRVMDVLTRLSCLVYVVLVFVEKPLSVLAWERPAISLYIGSLLLTLLWMEADFSVVCFIAALYFLQQRLINPHDQRTTTSALRPLRHDEVVLRWLRLVRSTRRQLYSSQSDEEVLDALATVSHYSIRIVDSISHSHRRMVAQALLALSAVGLVVPAKYVCLVLLLSAFLYTPTMRLLVSLAEAPAASSTPRRRSLDGVSTPPALSDASSCFTVSVQRLEGFEVDSLDGRCSAVVQVKCNGVSWMSQKTCSPWIFETTTRPFALQPSSLVALSIFDLTTNLIGSLCEGHYIVDDTSVFGVEIAVPLHPSAREHSLLRDIVESVHRHEMEDKRRYLVRPDDSLKMLRVKNCGSVIIVLRRASSASPKLKYRAERSNNRCPEPLMLPPAVELPAAAPPLAAQPAHSVESITRDPHSDASSRAPSTSTGEKVVFSSGGCGSVRAPRHNGNAL